VSIEWPVPAMVADDEDPAQWFSGYGLPPPTGLPVVEVRIAVGTVAHDEAAQEVLRVTAVACERLGLPEPVVDIDDDDTLPTAGYELAIGGVVRISGSFDTSLLDWWRQHPVAGPDGRTGLAPATREPGEPLPPVSQLARAAEEAVWDDPGLLVPEDKAELRALLPSGLYVTEKGLTSWRSALRKLAAMRVPLGPLQEEGQVSPDAARLAPRLRPFKTRLVLGSDLYAQAEPNRRGPEGEGHRILLDELLRESGVLHPPSLAYDVGDGLDPWGWRIEVNGLPRAAGVLPDGRVCADGRAPEPGVPLWVNPRTAAVWCWIQVDVGAGLSHDEVLSSHLGACLEEAAVEHVDGPWVEGRLDQLGRGLPALSAALRAWPIGVLTTALGALVTDGLSLRDRRVLECLTEFGEVAAVDMAADGSEARWLHELAGTVDDSDAVAEFVRCRIGEPLRARHRGRPVAALSAALVARLRSALSRPASSIGAYGYDETRGVLRGLDALIRQHGAAVPPVLLVPLDLRAAVARLVRAQFPRVDVVSRHELDPEPTVVADLSTDPI
jgi:hypothetical protein